MPFFSLMGSFEITFVISVKFSNEMEMFEHENNSYMKFSLFLPRIQYVHAQHNFK